MQDAHELRCQSVEAAERAYALGYATVALETVCEATHASDATPLIWGAPRDVDAPALAGDVQRRGAVIVLGLVHVDADRDHRPDVRRRDAQLLLLLFRLLLFCAFFKLKRRPTPCFLLP